MTSFHKPVPSVWVLTNAPSPYQVELFSELARRADIQLEVRFLRDADQSGPRRRFPNRIVRTWLPLSRGDELRLHLQPMCEAGFARHDLFILSGLYTSLTFLCCAVLLTLRRRRWAVWWERPHARHFAPHRFFLVRWLHAIKESVRRWLLRHAQIVIGVGSAAVREYQQQGVPRERLCMLPYCCDVTRFATTTGEMRESTREALGWQDRLIFLFSGQMIPRKGVDTLLKAFIPLAQKYNDVVLLLLGQGSELEALKEIAPEPLRSRIRFEGQVPHSQLPQFFSASDVFAFASRHDGWAVVLNEACAAGLPIIATHQTGAAHDLIEEGNNGFHIEADDDHALHQAMEWFVIHRDRIPEMGQRSRQLVEPFSVESGAQTLVNHVHYALSLQDT